MSARRTSHRRRYRPLRVTLLAAALAVVALGLVMAWQAWSAVRSAEQASVELDDFRDRLFARDVAGAQDALSRAQQSSQAARTAIDGPLWGLLTRAPALGDDVDAARRLSVTVDDVTQGALPPVMTALAEVDPRDIGLRDGRIALPPLRQASDQLSRADELLRVAADDAAAIETAGLMPALGTRVSQVQDQLTQASGLATNAALAGKLLPGMLGGGGPRDYLLLAQNSAEQRSLGGIPGALALLRAEGGEVSLVQQAAPSDIGSFEEPILPLSEAEQALYGQVLGLFPANVTDTPDFPRAAQLIKAMWEERQGGTLDGVASVDPWALQLILGAVGPVETAAGQLTGENAAERLLVGVYAEVADPDEQDAVFAQAAQQVFDAVRGAGGDPGELTRALAAGVDQGRVMVWSAREAEQELLAGTPLGRTLADPTPQSPTVGVYLHDRTQSKMSTYQRVNIRVRPESCEAADTAQVRVTIASAAPADRDLPESVTGDGSRVPQGDMLTQLVVYAPPGWTFSGVESSDGRDELVTYEHDGLWASTRDFLLTPGQSETLTLRMRGEAVSSEWEVRYTPGTRPDNVLVNLSGCA